MKTPKHIFLVNLMGTCVAGYINIICLYEEPRNIAASIADSIV
jgi:hypothetical protein